jgi:hypothetical protein
MSEFPRPFDVRQLDHRAVRLVADEGERRALAARFDLVRIDRLEAEVTVTRDGAALEGAGMLEADIVQSCAVSAEDLPVAIREPLVELEADDLDEIPFNGTTVDLGEAVAQSLALAIDPFATGPEADQARALLKDEGASPFAALKGLNLRKE